MRKKTRILWAAVILLALCSSLLFALRRSGRDELSGVPGVVHLRASALERRIPRTLMVAHPYPLSNRNHLDFSLYFAQYTEQQTKDVRFEIYESNNLVAEEDLLACVEQGTCEMAMTSSLLPYTKEGLVLELPALFGSYAAAREVLSSAEVKNHMNDALAYYNISLLYIGIDGYKYIFMPGQTPAQGSGGSVLCQENLLDRLVLRGYGFNPVETAIDLYAGHGYSSGYYYPLSVLSDYHMGGGVLYETNRELSPYYLVMNRAVYYGLSDQVRKVIDGAVANLESHAPQSLAASERKIWEDGTITVSELSAVRSSALAGEIIGQFFSENPGDELQNFYELLKK
jgi:TRAP-type C4-dicarboxylate transport system substrate-binding protein